jgi:hypothetical protein
MSSAPEHLIARIWEKLSPEEITAFSGDDQSVVDAILEAGHVPSRAI